MINKQSTQTKYSLTVVVTRSYESQKIVEDCLQSLERQEGSKVLVLFLDQKVSDSTKEHVKSRGTKSVQFKYINIPAKSLSFARNYGLDKAASDYVAFCDVDCILEKNWTSEILKTFKEENAAIVGTKILPKWEGKIKWFHRSKFIQEFYSLIDISRTRQEIPKVIGASFAIDKAKLGKEAYFDEKLGRGEGRFIGGEETDLCQRARTKKLKIVYTPFTHTYHQVSRKRIGHAWLLRRVYFGGLARALKGGKAEPFNQKRTILDKFAIIYILPFYLMGFIKGRLTK